MKQKSIGTWFTVGGLLLIAAALCLVAMNFYEEARAAKAADAALAEILAISQTASSSQQEESEAPDTAVTPPEEDVQATSPDASEAPETVTPELQLPDYIQNPNMEMPVRTVQALDYIGILDIPELDISLPIISEWSYPKLKVAPCRFSGSVYLDNLIILGHNYRRHLGALKEIEIGEKVSFTDMDGNVFKYKVSEIVILDGDDIESMMAEGEWDFTLFTCTMSGQTRITVRCVREDA